MISKDFFFSKNVHSYRPSHFKIKFLAHQIRISDILSWVINSNLTQVIFPMLSSGVGTLAVFKLLHHLLATYSESSGSLFLKTNQNFMVSRKKSRIEKSVPRDYRLPSLRKPHDANR